MLILGIETSCDETAASLLQIKSLKNRDNFRILSNIVSSQIPIHRQYGGIIPEVAARAHIENILPVIKKALKSFKLEKTRLPPACRTGRAKQVDLIAVTNGPGLVTSLLVGIETAKTLAYTFQKSLMAINHLEGHIYANFVGKSQIPNPKSQNIFPAICLIVSGGHTELGLMKNHGQYKKIGQTRDDAAGECFDKIAKLLNIGYPGGPVIAQQARQLHSKPKTINFKLPRPMINSNDFDFSFSGLKTAVLYLVKKNKEQLIKKRFIQSVCAESQQAIIDVLIFKTVQAVKKHRAKSVLLSGGVAANQELRKQLKSRVYSLKPEVNFFGSTKKFMY